ncbi:STAS domain-containing protein [Cryptosporangium arvum]|uniref:STAS domain-containing protein n=1 Tax=Cryptosporangium arvum TaxID=80871 RepID=UPI0004BA2B6D|nr:STAS domain-containing protein [Cryptosporangium arvum]
MTDHQLTVTVRVVGRTARVALHGELEHRTAPILLDALTWLHRGLADTLVLDCRELTFVDARGLSTMLRARAVAARAGAALVLDHPSVLLSRMLLTTGLVDALPVVDQAHRRDH